MTGPVQIPKITLESLDGSRFIVLDGTAGWIRMPGSTGLKMPPYEVIASAIPGVPGSLLQEVRTDERPVFIPIYCGSTDGHRTHLDMLDEIRSLVDPTTSSFRIVGSTVRGERELLVTYTSGLEGADGEDNEGMSWCKIGLNAVAHEPYARDRLDRTLEYRVSTVSEPFLGIVGNSDTPFPRALSSSSVIGSAMPVDIGSEVPVYPTLELVGPMTSFSGELSPVVTLPNGTTTTIEDLEWFVDVPLGVPSLSTLVMVTDPRARSIRLDGNLAAGRVARGSTLRPFYPGQNLLNVAAPGGTDATRIRVSWRNLYRSLW